MSLIFRRFLIFLTVLGVLFFSVSALTSIPVTSEEARYIAVSSPDRNKDILTSSSLPNRPSGDFIVYADKLYLKVQGTRSAVLLVTFVSRYDWTPVKLKKFRAEHPELDRYFPDPAQPNAGVPWIPNKQEKN